MSEKTYTKEELLEAAKVGAEAAIEAMAKEKQKEDKNKRDRRLRNTKLLLSNYRNFKEYSINAIYSAEQAEDLVDILDLMWDPNNRSNQIVESIKKSAIRTKIIMTHIESMLNTYRDLCEKSKNPTDKRKYSVLFDRYFADEQLTIDEIAKKHSIEPRTVYLDIDAAINVMAVLIFGVDCILGNKRNS